MHELLGIIYYICYKDSKGEKKNEDLSILLDENFVEHDSFLIFERIMSRMKDFFEVQTEKSSKVNKKN
jgi:hypothetical protein